MISLGPYAAPSQLLSFVAYLVIMAEWLTADLAHLMLRQLMTVTASQPAILCEARRPLSVV